MAQIWSHSKNESGRTVLKKVDTPETKKANAEAAETLKQEKVAAAKRKNPSKKK